MRRLARAMTVGALRLLALGAALAIWLWLWLPWPVLVSWTDPGSTSLMRYRMRQLGDSVELRHQWAPLERIAPVMGAAVITAEDGRFREHGGVDWEALGEELSYDGRPPFSWTDRHDLAAVARAIRYGVEHRSELRGRSTITQQLAKNLYFTPERSLPRKVAELFVAQRLEWLLSKDRILELYLNTVELGPGIFGVEAAARAYFGVSAAELTRWQAATLAATLPHPLTSNPERSPGRMAWRRDLILRYLEGGGPARIPERPADLPAPSLADPSLPPPDTGVTMPELEGEPDTLRVDSMPPDTLARDTTPPAVLRVAVPAGGGRRRVP